jgi:flagellum-specific ATP synthase
MSVAELKRLASISRSLARPGSMIRRGGRISQIGPDFFCVQGIHLHACVNDRLEFMSRGEIAFAKVLKITSVDLVAVPFGNTEGLVVGDEVYLAAKENFHIDENWLGRVLDPLGRPLDGMSALERRDDGSENGQKSMPILGRRRVSEPLRTGIKAIDIFTPLCFGQRIGIFAGSGVGKSTLLGMLAKSEAFDCVVLALIGERSREVVEFLEDVLGQEARAKTLTIVAASDASALMRHTAPKLAMEAASNFRSQGKKVLLLMDSVTRFAHATREIASASGEPPIVRGYPATVFAELPKLLEPAGPGMSGGGSITAIVTVLVDGDDHNEPISDAVRGILDGHIVLDREIANQGRYPPINLLSSISRLANVVWSQEQSALVSQLRALVAKFEDTADLRALGTGNHGRDPELEQAIGIVPKLYAAMRQSPRDQKSPDAFADLLRQLKSAGDQINDQAA